MILCRSPLRISFFGGGTDFDYYVKKNGYGATLNCSIDKYLYLTINKTHIKKIKLNYSKLEIVNKTKHIKHRAFKKILEKYKIKNGIEISTFADIKAGVGLSSSSAFCSGLILSLEKFFKNKNISPKNLFIKTYKFERETLKNITGFQDQFIITNGGIRYTKYFSLKKIKSIKINITKKINNFFQKNLILIETKFKRNYEVIAKNQRNRKIKNTNNLNNMREMAEFGKKLLKENKFKEFGYLIKKNWLLKKTLSKAIGSKKEIKYLELFLEKKKAWGYKILGAGGGGMMLVCGNQKLIKFLKKYQKLTTYNILPTCDKTEIIYKE